MKVTLTALALTAAIGLAACGGSNDNGTATASSASTTVSLHDGVLVDSKGDALYTSAQERDGMVRCADGCMSIWLPLTTNAKPTAASDVSGAVGIVKRPDGSRQVTLDGRPLYRFAEDPGPGKVTGDGVKDSFGGQHFTWHVEGTSDTSSSGSSGSSYGY